MNILERMKEGDYEEVVFHYEPMTGLKAIVAIHNTTLGPSLGGTRMLPYASEEEALTDVLRLARAMTYKAALAGLDVGGGKAVIIGDPNRDKNEALLRAYGRFVHSLGGRYITTTDVGTYMSDMDTIHRETAYVTGYSPVFGGGGDTSILTALTVYLGMKASAQEAFGSDSLKGMTVAVQGVGKVGRHLIERLADDNCRLYVTDINPEPVAWAVEEMGATSVQPDEIYDVTCDIFSPNSLGAILNDETIPRLNCKVVCGGANNTLAEDRHAEALAARGILFAPDFVVNCGGIINAANELWGYNAQRAEAMAQRAFNTTLDIFAAAKKYNITPLAAAYRLAEQRIHQVGSLRHYYLPNEDLRAKFSPQ